MECTTIEDVRKFWDINPLLVGEFDAKPDMREWSAAFDAVKSNDIFKGDLSRWAYGMCESKNKILDVGCGPGYWHWILGANDIKYFGIDISPKSVRFDLESIRIFCIEGCYHGR